MLRQAKPYESLCLIARKYANKSLGRIRSVVRTGERVKLRLELRVETGAKDNYLVRFRSNLASGSGFQRLEYPKVPLFRAPPNSAGSSPS